jgi:hypothetical protein
MTTPAQSASGCVVTVIHHSIVPSPRACKSEVESLVMQVSRVDLPPPPGVLVHRSASTQLPLTSLRSCCRSAGSILWLGPPGASASSPSG